MALLTFRLLPTMSTKKLINSKWGKTLKISIILALALTCTNFQKVSTL